ncbi:MAG: DUF998 domain-containing protein [Candidatus Lokiarchaeota archaeon]|nr:DUF998 domain-containing protein [Candidatus Lokiarchaeota archaeon]
MKQAMPAPRVSNLKAIWTGTASKRLHLQYFAGVLAIYIAGTIISAAMYPGGFSFTTVYTSYLGGTTQNPVGRYFYNIAELLTGVLLVPHFIFMYTRLVPACKALSFIACLFGIVGSLGFAAIGIYAQGVDYEGHRWTTILAFGGFGVSALLMLSAFIRKAALKHAWPKWWHVAMIYGPVFGTIGVVMLCGEFNVAPAIFTDQFNEWVYLFVVMAWIIEIPLITPADEKK